MAWLATAYLTPLWDIELLAAWSFAWSHYPDSQGVEHAFDSAQPTLRRRDSVNVLTLEVGRGFLDEHLRVGLRYQMTDSASSIASYDYTRHVVGLVITGGL